MKKLETTKLFWGKYLYKLAINNSIGSIFRDKNLSHAREVLDTLQQQYESGQPLVLKSFARVLSVSELSFLDARKLYKFLVRARDDYTLRIQNINIRVYSNNHKWIHTLKSAINKDNLLELWEPNPSHIPTLDSNTIIVDSSNGYEYKVTFGVNVGDTSGFANWAKNNTRQVKVGPVLLEQLTYNGYVNDMYFYARDEKTLQLCSLMLSNVRRVDKLVVKSDIDK